MKKSSNKSHRFFVATLSLLLIALTACKVPESQKPSKENLDYVNMFVGTTGTHVTEYGGTTPAVGTPFAMTQWCAVTRENKISRTMYHYNDKTCLGFMASHQPAVWMGDYGFFTFMPQTETPRVGKDRDVELDRTKEISTPYYYKLPYKSAKGGEISTEFTATSRASFFKIAYPKNEKPLLYIEVAREASGGEIEFIPEKNEIRLFNKERHDAHLGPKLDNLKGYYVLKFNAKYKNATVWKNGEKLTANKVSSNDSLSACIEFDTSNVEVKIGSSFIDYSQAESNLENEIPSKMTFCDVVENVKNQWRKYFDKIELDAPEADKRIFFTALFRTLQYPREFSEYGRYYSAFDDKIHEGESYNAFSLWDTFRAEHPWLQIIAPERVSPMIQSLVQMYEEGGWIPKWPNPSYTNIMIGTHADAVIADAYVNGFRDYNVKKAYEAIRKNATTPPQNDKKSRWKDRGIWQDEFGYEGRSGLSNYIEKGFVSSDFTNESVSRTLEFALDDYCVAQMAKALGHTEDYNTFIKRSENYRNLYHSETGFFRAKHKDGKWHKNQHEGMTESQNWQYKFCVMQNPNGLIELMGGSENFEKNLDEVFEKKHYSHDNEPSHHYAYLYNFCDRFDKVQLKIPQIIEANYQDKPEGLSGNDDCGQMSAWYIFSSMGFYPLTPASGEYALGIPRFKNIRIQLANGKVLEISAPKVGEKKLLQKVSYNGKKLEKPFIKIQDIFNGGILKFE